MQLATSLYQWLLFLHILAATIWLGGLVVVSLLATLVLRSEPDLVKRLLDSLRIVGPVALGAPMLALLGFGIWMVVRSEAWNFGQDWVIAGLCLFAAAFVIGVGFQARAAIAAQRALEAGDREEGLRQFHRWSWGMRAIVVVLVIALWDMVAKPGL